MKLPVTKLAAAACLLAAPIYALAEQDIPADIPVSELLSSAQGHLSRGETTEALLYYDAAVARDPSNYLTFFKRATTYLSLGRTTQATEDFHKVLGLKPGFEGAHVQLAKIRVKVADWEGAREQYVLGGKGNDSPEVSELDEAHGAAKLGEDAFRQGGWENCVNHLSTAIALAPRAAALRDMRARCRLEMGIMEEAMSDLQHVLHLRPGDISPYMMISAITFYALGDLENGQAHIRKCLHSDPDSKPCLKLRRQERATEKMLGKVNKALESGKPMSAIKMLVDQGDETGLMTDIANDANGLREQGYIPPKAPNALYTQVVELVCRAYFDVS
jgi:DnaJ homolog subfamily C member 3